MKQVIAYVHTHWDREWYREFEEFRLRLIEVTNEIIELILNNEIPCFYFDGQTAAIEDYLEIFPEKTELIKKLVKEKKLRIGPFYCSADSFLVSGEALYRNYEIGMQKAKEFGETDFIGYLSDTFGHSRLIPNILKSLGINKACMWRGLGNIPADFNQNGIKTVNLVMGYFQDFLNSELEITRKAELLKKYIDKISEKSGDYVLFPIGADHLTPPKNLKKQIDNLNKIYSDYKIKISSPFEYFDKIKPQAEFKGEFLDNSRTFILPGVYSSRLYLKRENTKAQFLITREAEPIQALSEFFFGTKNRQNETDYAYKTLLKNHAHDSIYGCSTDEVHREVMQRLHNVETIAQGIIKRCIRDSETDNGTLEIINLSQYPYSGKIIIRTEKKLPDYLNAVKTSSSKGFTDKKLYNINDIPVTEDITAINEYLIDVENIPPFSIKKLTPENIRQKSDIKTTKNSIENRYVKLSVKNGNITVTDKIKNETYEDFIKITDCADIGDSYNFGPLKGDIPLKSTLKKAVIKESNKIRAVMNLKFEIAIPETSTEKGRNKKILKHTVNTEVVLYNGLKHIEFTLDWKNKSKNHLLSIGFKLKNKIKTTLNDDLFGTTERTFNPDFDIYKHIPAPRGKEIKPNTSPLQRFMQTENFALFSKGNTEYEIFKNEVKLTLLRATGIISNPKNPSRGTPAGPPILTPELQCIGENKAEFAIAFEKNENELYKISDEYFSPYIPIFSNIKDTRFIESDNENILVYAIKTDKDGLLTRLFNKSKKKENVNLKIKNSVQNISFEPEEIKTVVIKN